MEGKGQGVLAAEGVTPARGGRSLAGGDLGEGWLRWRGRMAPGEAQGSEAVAGGRRQEFIRTCLSEELGGERRQGLGKDVVS